MNGAAAVGEDRLEVEDLACAAGIRILFDGVGFTLGPGQWIRLRGPNGCGKSTLLRALAGLGRPVGGTVRWRGAPTSDTREQWHAAFAYQGHLPACKDGLSAAENLHWQLALDGEASSPARLRELLGRVGIERQARLAYQRLSAGQRRRLGLARLVALHRPLWLLDEPTTALDADGQALFGELLDAHLAAGGLAICATHLDLPVGAAAIPLELGGRRGA
ncbi:MAG: heme ABC exporter ATP-binding protein CcmA [Burkholderiaceae bacterium]